ncbi:MAG: filamentous hemagglutinin N-terminal domain-containing protein [Nitrospira sp.]|nr:filamentous hemagglutinin N-terminal domain-containing protein [Nitrospira sp.]
MILPTKQLAYAQTSPITSSGLNTQVSAPIAGPIGTTQFNITGGTRPGNGPNLFHSFGEFGVPVSNIANFLNETALPTSHILARVTGGNPSNIFGTIQTIGFGSANLFLMNPAGIVFGPNASLNVGGSVSFTTADYLRLADSARFTAIPGPQDASISSAPVAAFGFLGTNQAAITVQGSQLAVTPSQGLSLVGGDIAIEGALLAPDNVQPARISAPGGQINLVSVAAPGEVLASSLQSEPNINGQSFTNMGNISLSGGSTLDVSADAAGTVKIRGGRLVMDNSTLSADTGSAAGTSIAMDILVTGDLTIAASTVPVLSARTSGTGNAGEIRIESATVEVSSQAEDSVTLIDTHTSGSGRAGNVNLRTGDLQATLTGLETFIDSGTIGPAGGQGGDVNITATNIRFGNVLINSGVFPALIFGQEAAGSAGNVTMTADTIQLMSSTILTIADLGGSGGDITLSARDIQLREFSGLGASGFERAGNIRIDGQSVITDSSQVDVTTWLNPGGGITISGNTIELRNGSTITSQTRGDGTAGAIRIMATDHLTLSDDPPSPGAQIRPTGLFTNSFGDPMVGTRGDAGAIVITTPQVKVTGGARIDSSTQTSGRGGDVTLTTNQSSLSGERPTEPNEPSFNLGSRRGSGIFTRTVGNEFCPGRCGDAGTVSITTDSLTLANGAQINSGTTGSGRGGDVTVHAADQISVAGTMVDGTPSGIFSRSIGTASDSGVGGDTRLTAGQSASLSNGATISASSTGPADAGNIAINAGAQFLSQNASVTTQASQASGGNITVQATDSIRLINSQLNTSVQGGPTTSGGNITIDPAIMTLQNSQILAQAVQGQGGNINIIAGTFLADPTSVISASSQFGLSGTVNIQSPVSSLSGSLATLPQRPLQTQILLRQRCAAQVSGQLSSLVVSGRDALPVEPGGWLMSPMVLMADHAPAPQAHVATNIGVESSHQNTGHSEQASNQRDPSSQRGGSDRATGCGS